MALQILKRPYEKNWSGNPIHYSLYSDLAEADPANYFEIKIKFKRLDAADYSDIIVIPLKPVMGTVKIDIQDILDGLLDHEMPWLPASNEYASPYNSNKATGFFYIQFREIKPDDLNPAWIDTESATPLLVVKGGISWEKWRGDNYWVNYFTPLKPFLTWQLKNGYHSLKERMYLAWLNTTTATQGELQIKRTVKFTDGSENVQYLDLPIPQWYIVHFPTGAAQNNLETIDPNKTIYYWEFQVFNTAGVNPEEPLSELYRYYADYNNDYNAITLNYRNSLGGIDSLRIRGVIDYTNERQFTQTERVVLHDYFINHFIKGRTGADNSTELLVYKGDAGYLPKEEQDRTRDIHFMRECWWEQDLKWLPVMILTSSNRLRISTDKLFPFPVEFAIASGGEYYYTPRNVNLNEAADPTGYVCPAVIGSLTAEFAPGTGWVINWQLVSGNPQKYFISTPGISGGAPHETANLSYTYPWLPVGTNVITIWPMCYIGGVWYPGAPQEIEVEVAAACVGVGFSGGTAPNLPDAIEDQDYSFIIPLTGTAPFALANVTKPAWMNIAVNGSNIEFTGTPANGDIGADIEVSFDITNCSGGNTINFDDEIDVLADAANGSFLVDNNAEPGNFFKGVINSANPFVPFFTFSTGGFPVLANQQADGSLTQAISTPISVNVVIADSEAHVLTLKKNGVMIEAIGFYGSGIYSFPATAFLITDDMEIILE